MRTHISRLSTVTLGVAALAAGTAVLATPASAAVHPNVSCSSKPSGNSARTGKFTTNGVNIRSGPSTSCTALGSGFTSNSVELRCVTNEGSTTWFYLTDKTTGVTGWSEEPLAEVTGATTVVIC